MCKNFFIILSALIFLILPIKAYTSKPAKIHPFFKDLPKSTSCKSWILFKDKPISEKAYSDKSKISDKAKPRRIRRTKHDKIDFTDIPVSPIYIEKVVSIGGILRVISRWLNAISIETTVEKLIKIAELDFVISIEPVMDYRSEDSVDHFFSSPGVNVEIQYGKSLKQIEQIKVDSLHEKGYHGENVLIGLLDTGFRLSHKALKDIDIVSERDFIYQDEMTANQPQQDDDIQDEHGTFVLSVIAGNEQGNLIGPAFSASYLLGKTEKVSQNGQEFEKTIEEDWWIQGLEWMESMGVDVVNSSLGYSDWYRFSDLDGKTAKVTKAANIAAEKGVIVVVAAGNTGSIQSDGSGLKGHVTPPADGFDVLAVGSVNHQGIVAGSSSRGPTYDGRIKPDLMAMGVNTIVADPKTKDAYIQINGTSMASPLVAGVAALLLQAFPDVTVKQIIEALKQTASEANSPNNNYGWGIVNAEAAYDFILAGQISVGIQPSDTRRNIVNSNWGRIKKQSLDFSLGQNYPNPFNPETYIPFKIGHDTNVLISIYDMQGRIVRQINLGYLTAGEYIDNGKAVLWDGINRYGEKTASGCYFYQLHAGEYTETRKMMIGK